MEPCLFVYGPRKLYPYSNSLRAGQFKDRIPVVARLFAPAQTGPGGPPSLLENGYRISYPGEKLPEHVADHPSLSCAKVIETIQLYF